jgi:hypothetical protein
MNKMVRILMTCITIVLVLNGCGPSQEELDAQATETAVAHYATQTAEAPTPTPTPTPTNTPTPTPTLTPTPTPTPVSAQAMLEAAQAAMSEVDSYSFAMDMEIEVAMEGITMEMPFVFVGAYQAPDRVQYVITMTVLGETTAMEGITIGETSYIKNPLTGAWETTTESTSPISPEDIAQVGLEQLRALAYVGEETLGETPVYHLQATLSAGDLLDEEALGLVDMEGEFAVDYWVGVRDDLFRQAAMEGEMSVASEEEDITMTMAMTLTMTFSDFGVPVSIEAPLD